MDSMSSFFYFLCNALISMTFIYNYIIISNKNMKIANYKISMHISLVKN
ncbi:hypothetical protein CNEO4_600019 [Clostridium neonatale]|nr:hypothetical protein CNEO4_600019 [Clostridium neonatale]CAI3704482.1 hypothetical protein CNEO4_610009 [Clostridium neonatale]